MLELLHFGVQLADGLVCNELFKCVFVYQRSLVFLELADIFGGALEDAALVVVLFAVGDNACDLLEMAIDGFAPTLFDFSMVFFAVHPLPFF